MAERRLEMTKLQGLNVFLTERLMLAAQDIYRAVESTVESTVLQYRGELRRERRENRRLRRTLTEAGIQWPEREPFGSLEFDEEDFLPVGKEPESEPSPLPEKQEYNPRSGQSECGSLDSKSTPVVSHGNSDYTPDQTCVAAQHREHQSRLQDRREDDFVSISPSNQIKVETGAPAPEGLSLDAEGLSLDAECPPSAQSQGSVVSMMESDRLLSRFDAVQQFPQHLFQIHDGGGAAALSCTAGGGYTAKPCGRRLAHLNTHHLLHHHHHAGERGFLCGLCGKAFSSSGRLKGHQRIHTGEKPYQCHVCMKRFNQTAHLKVHLRVHTGEKPFSCPVCGKSFTQSNKVKRHLITHTRD